MNFVRFRNLYFLISLVFLIPGIISLLVYGLRPAIDFTGGSLLEVKIVASQPELTTQAMSSVLTDQEVVESIQQSDSQQFIIKGKPISNEQKDELIKVIEAGLGEVQEVRFAAVGPLLGRELLVKTLVAVAIVAGLITVYVWRQFDQLKFGVCAILAMFHDSLILLGSFSLLGHFLGVEVDILFVTALLTTLSFSIHDTIVVYDQIRELKRRHSKYSFTTIANTAVVKTLSRSINNSVTIILMLLTLSLLGGQSIRWFAVALLIGAVTGTYSSTFTAVPLLLLWDEVQQRLKAK